MILCYTIVNFKNFMFSCFVYRKTTHSRSKIVYYSLLRDFCTFKCKIKLVNDGTLGSIELVSPELSCTFRGRVLKGLSLARC